MPKPSSTTPGDRPQPAPAGFLLPPAHVPRTPDPGVRDGHGPSAPEADDGRHRRASTPPGRDARFGRRSAEVTVARGDVPEVRFDVTVLDGEAGRRLAVLQAEVILDMLTWLHDQRHHAEPV
ncbi:hypothetical protein [Salinispora tropica]|uniref:hypothetical protein n=1 Tax=Salinispora tropica TaxID=168695 RepID=UPI0005BC6F4F|nr:hypothetical protein [Salinispora tropica]